MSVPPDAITGLLQSLQQQQQPQGGILGNAMSDPNAVLGMSLLANSNTPGRFGSILGRSMMDAQNFQNQQQLQKLNIAQQALALGRTGQQFNAINDYMSTDQANQGGAEGGNGLLATSAPGQSAQTPPLTAPVQVPPGLNPPTANSAPIPSRTQFDVPQGDVFSTTSISGHTPRQFMGLQLAFGEKPNEAEKATRELQLQTAQAAMKPRIGLLDQLVDSDQPSQMVKASGPLQQFWYQSAPSYGISPTNMTDDNVRRVASARRNELASWAQLPTVAPPTPLQTVQTGVGGSIQIDPKTHKITAGAPQQETAQFVMPDGTIKLMTKAQGMAKGLSPYEAGTYVNPGTSSSIAQQIASYKMAPLTGQALRTAQGQDTMRQVMAIDPGYDATRFAVKSQARTAFATGQQGNTVRSLSVATDHLDQLAAAARELQNTGIPGANSVANFFGKQIGNPAVTNFDSMKEIVSDEVVKAVVGTSGAAGDREAIKS